MSPRARRWLPRLPYLVLWAVMLYFHLRLTYVPVDELTYGAVMAHPLDFGALLPFLARHYQTWSSRILIEGLFCIFSTLPVWVWRLLEPCLIALTARLLAALLGLEEDLPGGALLCFLVYLYQWHYLSDAGWVVTSIAYLWPVTMGLAALGPLASALRGRDVPAWQWGLCCVLLAFAANMEQAALVLLALLAAGIGALLTRRARVPAPLWVQLALTAGSLAFVFTCPGNAARTAGDIASFYPDYSMLSALQKVEIGISGALAANVYGRDSIFFLFAVLVALANHVRRSPLPARLLSLAPCLLLLPLSLFRYQVKAVVPGVPFFTEAYSAAGYINLTNFGDPKSYLPLLMCYGIFALCLLGVVGAFGWGKTTCRIWFLLAVGGMSQAAMGFTPSVGVSSRRTGIFFSFCIIAACGLLWCALAPKPLPDRAARIGFGAACLLLGGIQWVYLCGL